MTDFASATITRLTDTSPLKKVAGLLSLAALVKPPVDKMPAAYVLPPDVSYGPNGLLNAVRQEGPQSLRIVLFIAVRAPEGADVFDPVEPVTSAVIARLLGWQPDAAFGQVLLRSGKLLDLQPTHIAYELVFFRSHTIRAA